MAILADRSFVHALHHVSVKHEAETSEHALFFKSSAIGEVTSDEFGQTFIVCHFGTSLVLFRPGS
jgi:hypothetical protein